MPRPHPTGGLCRKIELATNTEPKVSEEMAGFASLTLRVGIGTGASLRLCPSHQFTGAATHQSMLLEHYECPNTACGR
jgi:hypothetical protein